MRIKLRFGLFALEPSGIELGVEVAADPVGADQHQRADRIARRLLHLGSGIFDALGLGLALDLVADGLLDSLQSPVSAAISSPLACGDSGAATTGRWCS